MSESNLLLHARRELALLRGPDFDAEEDGGMQDEMDRCILDVIKVFSEQGHSGMSAAYAISCIEKLLRFEPITPLTGADDEWNDVGDGMEQNNRCGRVFREGYRAYDIEGRVFREPNGSAYTSRDSSVEVTFPYTPSTEYVDVPADEDDR